MRITARLPKTLIRFYRSSAFWGIVYLVCVPFFAVYYTYIIPTHFYHSNIAREPTFKSLTDRITENIKSTLISSIKLRHGNSKLVLIGKGSICMESCLLTPMPNLYGELQTYDRLLNLAESIEDEGYLFDAYIQDNKIFRIGTYSDTIRSYEEFYDLDKIQITDLSIDSENIVFNILFADPLNQYFLPKHNFKCTYSLLKINNGLEFSCLQLDSEKSFSMYKNIAELWTVSSDNEMYPQGVEKGITTIGFIILDTEYFTREFETFEAGLNGEAHKLDYHLVRMLYLSAVTQTTLGYGDITPITTHARLAIFIQSMFGLVLIGLLVARLTDSKKKNKKNERL